MKIVHGLTALILAAALAGCNNTDEGETAGTTNQEPNNAVAPADNAAPPAAAADPAPAPAAPAESAQTEPGGWTPPADSAAPAATDNSATAGDAAGNNAEQAKEETQQ
jgi:hypothetical protein